MKNIKELGLELIELEDQGLLVDKKLPVFKDEWALELYNGESKATSPKWIDDKSNVWWLRKMNMNCPSNDLECIKVLSSTKQLEGLPLLVIDDYINIPEFELELEKLRFQQGYDKARQIFKFTEEDLVEFAEWIEKEHWWKSTDTRFELTIGLWTKKINGNFSPNEGKLTKELLQIWKEQRAKKELWIEVESHCIVCDKGYDNSNRCKQVNGKAIICCLELDSRPKITDGKIKGIWK